MAFIDAAAQRRKDREEERKRRREVSGYKQQIQKTTDQVVRKGIEPSTKAHYANMLNEWSLFIEDYDGEPDPHNVKTAKDFIIFFRAGRTGRNDPEGLLTDSYVHVAWRWFMAAYSRAQNTSFPRALQDTIKNLIFYGEPEVDLKLSKERRAKRNFTLEDYVVCSQRLWGSDWHDFRHERYRSGLQLIKLAHCTTSARRREFETQWRYGDISLAMVWLEGKSQSQLMIDFCRSNAKGLQHYKSQQPENMLYELVGLPFYCNSVAFFMAAALADGVLRDYHTWDEICNIQKPPDTQHVILEYVPQKKHWMVFPRSTPMGKLDHERSSTTLTSTGVRELGYRAGFRDNLVLHAARREALLKVDNYGYSINERMRFAAHTNPNTYARYYQTKMPLVDGQAAFFNYEPANKELHELRRSYGWRRNPHNQPRLTAAKQIQLQDHMAKEASSRDQAELEDAKHKQKQYDRRRQQKDRLLRQQNADPPPQHRRTYESDFEQARHLMPERDRLATNLFKEGSLRDEVGRQVMQDLIHLCRSDAPPTLCLGLNARGTTCSTCGQQRQPDQEHKWWSHLYYCRREKARKRGAFAEFCFLCFQWYQDQKTWRLHAEKHLRAEDHPHRLPFKCSMAVFRHNVIRPALCPSCLSDGKQTPERRFRQFLHLSAWKRHVIEHVFQQKSMQCPHPRCYGLPDSKTVDEFTSHMADVHEISHEDRANLYALKVSAFANQAQKPIFVLVQPKCTLEKGPTNHKFHVPVCAVELERPSSLDAVCALPEDVSLPSPNVLIGTDKANSTISEVPYRYKKYLRDETVTADGDATGCFRDKSVRKILCTTAEREQHKRSLDSVVINVPPVPEEWKRWKRQRSERCATETNFHRSVKESKVTKSRQGGGRGRPKGSRNKKTLLAQRRATVIRRDLEGHAAGYFVVS